VYECRVVRFRHSDTACIAVSRAPVKSAGAEGPRLHVCSKQSLWGGRGWRVWSQEGVKGSADIEKGETEEGEIIRPAVSSARRCFPGDGPEFRGITGS
jgi:hypothetical protein